MTLLPNGSRLWTAATEALSHPWTWMPAATALAIDISGQDDDISDWAQDHTPIFGSQDNAKDMSSNLGNMLGNVAMVSMVFTDSGTEPGPWLQRKALGYGAFELSSSVNHAATGLVKSWSHRDRPDGTGDGSFPSRHTSSAFNNAVWTNSNLDYIKMPAGLRTGLKWANLVAASGAGWGRVEGARHYPTDVLLGAALGNATALFFQRAFVGIPEPGEPEIKLKVTPGGFSIGLHVSF